ncbi:hypothetical protein Tco_0025152 [Tanacetum coccineum]
MTTLQFADTHNLVMFLSKPAESKGFEQILDFLNANPIRYALTINPTIYTSCIEQFWAIIKVKTVNGDVHLQALVDGKNIIVTEASVRLTFNRKPKRKDTKIPQSSGPIDNVTDEAINEEMDDNLERVATTATSLDAEQDSGNIDKTPSNATPNEPSSLGTSLGGGPRRQETMGDTIAQTRFVLVVCEAFVGIFLKAKQSSLIPLSRGSFDVLVGMDRLSKRKFGIVCYEKVVRIPLEGDEILRVHGERTQGVVKT